jgi:uncharacterized SAM-binding protein YcdF (DUF218 family)
MKKVIKTMIFFVIAFGALFAVTGFIILSFGSNSKPVRSDCVIVLGCRLYGNVPSPFLKGRLDEGFRLYSEGYGKLIIVSGGMGNGETITEAEAMKAYLISKGVDSSKIITEDRSTSTEENLIYSKAKMEDNSLKTAVIISNRYHLKRASLIAEKIGMNGSYSGVFMSQHLVSEIKGFIREIPAFLYYYICMDSQY